MAEPTEALAGRPDVDASPDLSDEDLEVLWKQGSASAFAILFERYHTRVYAFALKLTHDPHMAEDLAQRAFLNIYRKPPAGTGKASFRSLIFTVVRNESLNAIKRRGRRKEAPLEGVGERSGDEVSPKASAELSEDQARLREALAQLPEEEREIVILREAEGLTFREICDTTGLSRDAVRWRLAKGMDRLRTALCPEGGAT